MLIAGLIVLLVLARGLVFAVLTPVIIGAVVSWLLAPLVKLLERKMKRGVAAGLALFAAVIVIVGIFAVLVPFAIKKAGEMLAELPKTIGEINAALRDLGERLSGIGIPAAIGDEAAKMLGNLGGAAAQYSEKLLKSLSALLSVFGTFVISLYFTFFFLTDQEPFFNRLLFFIPKNARKPFMDMMNDIKRSLSAFIKGQLLFGLAAFAMCVPVFLLAGLPGPIMLSALFGVFSLIPYIGPLVGSIPPILASLLSGTLLNAIIAVLIVQAVQSVLGPRIVGDAIDMHPVYIVMSVIGCAYLFGVVGALLAIPIVLVIRIVVSRCYLAIARRKLDNNV